MWVWLWLGVTLSALDLSSGYSQMSVGTLFHYIQNSDKLFLIYFLVILCDNFVLARNIQTHVKKLANTDLPLHLPLFSYSQ